MIETIAVTLLALFAVANVGYVFWTERNRYGFVWQVWKRFRFGMLCSTLAVLAATVVIGVVLSRVPGLSYGWMHLFYAKGGNALMQPVLAGSKSDLAWVRLLPLAFLAALTLAVPFLAHMEEEAFRHGVVEWPRIARRSVVFGLIHCIVGIPIAFGLALIASGMFYGYQYKRAFEREVQHVSVRQAAEEALMVSTAYHTLWNTLVCAILLALMTLAL